MPKILAKYVQKRLHKHNAMFSILLVGPPGSGKSYTALSLAEELDPEFAENVEKRILYDPKEFMDALIDPNIKRGSVLILDEMGVTANSRNFQSFINKMLSAVFQTVRSRNLIIICCAPHAAYIDIAVRKLFSAMFEVESIDRKRKVTIVKPLMISVSASTGQMYYKYPRVRHEGQVLPLKKLGFKMPSPRVVEYYEARKRAFQDKLYEDLLRQAQSLRAKQEIDLNKLEETTTKAQARQEWDKKQIRLTDKQKAVLQGLKDGKNVSQIASEAGEQQSSISAVKRSLEKKGIGFTPKYLGSRLVGFDVEQPGNIDYL